jgi:hypothetical protein
VSLLLSFSVHRQVAAKFINWIKKNIVTSVACCVTNQLIVIVSGNWKSFLFFFFNCKSCLDEATEKKKWEGNSRKVLHNLGQDTALDNFLDFMMSLDLKS